MADIQDSDEVKQGEGGKDYLKDINEFIQIGNRVLGVARERAENRYSMPYLDPQRFSSEDIDAIRLKSNDPPLSEEVVARARKGAVALAIEAAAQIAEAQVPRSSRVKEELESLEAVFTLVKSGHGFLIQTEAQNPRAVIQSSREALARRQKIQPELVKLTDEELKKWSNDNFQRAGQRINRSLQAVRGYLGR